ncbi:MAG TPA: cytochrome C, partial [Telluria sp.]|nr:cytochrome C [Telluria sp.]
FDHAKARFALAGAHVRVACASCHLTPRFRDAARECAACHQKADVHKGSLGAACESCHNVRDWRLWRFSHDRQTKYPLEGAHAKLRCAACHASPAPAGQPIAAVGLDCIACHAKDDEHERAYGTRCEQCHQPTRWKEITNPRLPPAGGGRP